MTGTVRAPAKINLGLRVLRRRSDGYHELESCFVPVDLADRLELAVEAAGVAEVVLEQTGATAGVPEGATNLAVRAAQEFLRAAGLARRVHVRLEKRVPVAGGLGGGSSDAGAVLRALARLLPGALSPAVLRDLAVRLGADVPFFLDPRASLVSGIGERIAPVAPAFPVLSLLLVNPGVPLATGAVFAAWEPGSGEREPLERQLAAFLRAPDDRTRLRALLVNDLESAAVRLCPEIEPLREALGGSGAAAVGLSGSGPTLYGVYATSDEAAAAARRLRRSAPPSTQLWVADTL